ncbi:acetylornithine deacetylase [Apibacter mensalis]|uniref:Acetylornithine deacetylase n=1 Tax=Apibacter mensalis TaxID=1586267 RepID=A0A0X3ARA3_9FLAO|nr:M20 family metallo-hydrolase [Apibacter mensalis]CVK16882.1 acetylornithine deacetylase [Apibacter mensalis]
MKTIEQLTSEAIDLLKKLIATPSFSGEEHHTALLIEAWFKHNTIPYQRENNNIWAYNKYVDESKPYLLLNSHQDTVFPNKDYTHNPFEAIEKEGKIFGLGSNDAGGCLVSLLATFTYFYLHKDMKYNLIMVASAEEENSGEKGLNSVLAHLPQLECAIIGEPTLMQLAIAEKGLLVLDIIVKGTAGHAAHNNPDNSIYNALEIIEWFKNYSFEKISNVLGPMKMTVSQIEAGKQHNLVPEECRLVVDIRVNDCYTNEEIVSIVKKNLSSEKVLIVPRSLKLKSSSIPKNHPLVLAGMELDREIYGSPTLSDQAVLNCPSLKMGPGNSLRSHTANEYIFREEIVEAIPLYIELLNRTIL